ncbi:MAG: hypothetical protein GPJ54_17765 [Candidatus Heimdallarchaeota archaeon]|nr:hypothetical protein [Candidatus Heimdallarchaeota archaeon]
MQYESIADLDVYVIIKLDRIYIGNMFIDGTVGICKVASYLLEIDLEGKNDFSLNSLFDFFEDEFSDVYDQIAEFYDVGDYISIAQDILNSISEKSVLRFCLKIYKKLNYKNHSLDLTERVVLLNQLLEGSKLKDSDILSIEQDCIDHDYRNLFPRKGRVDKNGGNKFGGYRFTLSKKVLKWMNSDKHSIRIEFIDRGKIKQFIFHKSDDPIIGKEIERHSRSLINNKDGVKNGKEYNSSQRVNLPPEVLRKITMKDLQIDLCIEMNGDKLEFILYAQ